MPFEYADTPHQRRHGPQGHADYKRYTPWLRDEFAFRCVYCLVRELWVPSQGRGQGLNVFSVDHLLPKEDFPELRCDYENLLYCCRACNTFKDRSHDIVDPCQEAYGKHLRVLDDGVIHALSNAGNDVIDICNLNRSSLVALRRRFLSLFRIIDGIEGQEAEHLRQEFLAFPDDLPDLTRETPPEGNTRPEGIASSFYAQRERGELAETY